MGNAVSGAITIMITTHPFVPNFAGEVDFSPDKLGPVTTFRAHSGGLSLNQMNLVGIFEGTSEPGAHSAASSVHILASGIHNTRYESGIHNTRYESDFWKPFAFHITALLKTDIVTQHQAMSLIAPSSMARVLESSAVLFFSSPIISTLLDPPRGWLSQRVTTEVSTTTASWRSGKGWTLLSELVVITPFSSCDLFRATTTMMIVG